MNPEHNSHKKIIQITEEAFRPLHVPLILANEWFVITQQDVRKVEDSRLLTYNKLMPNGELKPLDGASCDILAEIVRLRSSMDANIVNDKYLASLLNALANRNVCGNLQPQPMDFETECRKNCPTVATLQQQLHWEKSVNNLPMKNSSNCYLDISKTKPLIQNNANQENEGKVMLSTGIQTCNTYCCCKDCTNREQRITYNSIGTNTPQMKDTCSQTIAGYYSIQD